MSVDKKTTSLAIQFAEKFADLKQRSEAGELSNHDKRVLFCDIENLIILIENAISAKTGDVGNLQLVKAELHKLSNSATKLSRLKRPATNVIVQFLEMLDGLIRFICIWLFLMLSAILFAFPCILLRPLDYVLVKTGCIGTKYQISNLSRSFIANTFLKLFGVNLVVDRAEAESILGIESALVCFTHASSMDAFILASSIPVRIYSMAKSDLFLIPFFSWSLLAFGGLPVNRDNRDQAIRSLSKAAALAKMGDCVAVAPEGTRSLTGQLMPFKKGPFYLWEQLQTPIIPMVTIGAYDLCPPGAQVPLRGKVYVKLLKPIYPHEANSRDEMSRLVRRRMLEAIRDGPVDAGAELTWCQRIENILYIVIFLSVFAGVCATLWLYVPLQEFLEYLGIDIWVFLLLLLAVSVVITLLVYYYIMYVTYWIESALNTVNCCYTNNGYEPVSTEAVHEAKTLIDSDGSGSGGKYGSVAESP